MNARAAALSGYYFCYFAAQACMSSFLNVYLEQSLGFDGSRLGLFNGLTALLPVAILPLVGRWADLSGRGGWMLTGALLLVLLAADRLSLQVAFWGALIWGGVWETARSACVSLADKSAMELSPHSGRRYGLYRSFGSLGFLAGGMAMGFAAQRWGLGRVLFPGYLGLGGAATVLSFGFHAATPASTRRAGSWHRLLHLPGFRLALGMGVLGSVAVSGLQPYVGTHLVVTMGTRASVLSWNTLLCVVPECVLLPVFSAWVLPRWGFRPAFLVTALALGVRCLVYALAPTPGVFLAGSLLYGFSVCGYTAVNLAYLRQIAPPGTYATAVLVQGAASALGRAVFAWLFGVLYEFWGSGSIFWVVGILAFGATAAVLRTDCIKKGR